MKKAISILSIISVTIAGLSLLLAIVFLSVFWEPMCLRFSTLREVIEAGPIIPIGNMVYLVGCLAVTASVYACAKSSKGIAIEIVASLILGIVLPALVWDLNKTQTAEIGQTMEVYTLAALAAANSISNFACRLMNVAVSLFLVVCGMRISEKIILKKEQPNANQTVE